MSIGVGTGDYAEYNIFVPPVGGGPALLFVRDESGRYIGLLASDSVTWEYRALAEHGSIFNSWATNATNVSEVAIQAGTEETYLHTSTDGANTFGETDGDVLTAGVISEIVFRDGAFYIMLDGTDVEGGLYSSSNGLTWTRIGVIPIAFEFDRWGTSKYWAVTNAHVYYLTPDTSYTEPAHSLQVDSSVGSPEVQQVESVGTVSGGTFQLDQADAAFELPFNATDVEVKAILEQPGVPVARFSGLSANTGGGPLPATPITITFLWDGDQDLISIEDGLITGGGDLIVTEVTPGTSGHKNYPVNMSPQNMYSGFTGDVVLATFRDTTDDSLVLERYVGTSATVVTPGFFDIGDIFIMLRSADGTGTWVGVFNDVDAFTTQLAVSHDGGSSWTLVGPVSDYDICCVSFDPVDNTKWYALIGVAAPGYDIEFRLYTSTDDGDTWTDFGADALFMSFGSADERQLIPLGGKTN